MNPAKQFRADRSTAVLVLSNLVTIVFALALKWDIRDVMWIYWGQSVIIGIFTWIRMLELKQFSTDNLRINDKPALPTKQTQRQVAWFFLFHYGFFHLVYFMFLMQERRPLSGTAVLGIAACLLIFLVNHGFSYWHNRERDRNRTPNIGCVMFFPYGRILPMHLTIIFGSAIGADSGGALVLFLLLKTVADAVMHVAEHAVKGDSNSVHPTNI